MTVYRRRGSWRPGLVVGLVALAGATALAQSEAVEERMRKDITFLASAECEGRGVTTQGIHKAAEYIAETFRQSGLKPAADGGKNYFQPFTINAQGKQSKVVGTPTLKLKGPLGQEVELKAGDDFQPVGLTAAGKVMAPVVFAGYGMADKKWGYDDYQGLDVAGKVVVVLRRTPRWGNKDIAGEPEFTRDWGPVVSKPYHALLRKAAAVLLVNDATLARESDGKLLTFAENSRDQGGGLLPVLHVRRDVVDAMAQASLGRGLDALEADVARDLKPRGAALSGWTAQIDVAVDREVVPCKNVIGVLDGSGPLASETVVIGAHYDHLGYGGHGSLNKGKDKQIHHGADDNASGTTTMMELARRFGAMKNRQGRRLVFMAYSAEELGLWGSRHYCQFPLFPMADTVAMVNLDMVGRVPKDETTGKDKLIVEGLGTGKGFEQLVEKLNEKAGFLLVKKQSGLGPSDHDSFCRKKVPVFFFWNGTHKDYHRPTDTSDRINVPGMRKIADLVEPLVVHLTTATERPQFVQLGGGKVDVSRDKVPSIRFRPGEYDETVKSGVPVEDVTEGGPAAQAGLKKGDVIVSVAGRPVENMAGYMVIMAAQQRGRPVEFGVLRGKDKLTLKVTPQ